MVLFAYNWIGSIYQSLPIYIAVPEGYILFKLSKNEISNRL